MIPQEIVTPGRKVDRFDYRTLNGHTPVFSCRLVKQRRVKEYAPGNSHCTTRSILGLLRTYNQFCGRKTQL